MGAKREADDIVTVSLPRSAFTVVAAPPATVTQRTCLAHFGISKDDFLKMAGKLFPVSRPTPHSKLRIARYEDVAAALTSRLETKSRRRPPAAPPEEPPVKSLDLVPALLSLGFHPKK